MSRDATPLAAALATLIAVLRETAQARLDAADYYAALLHTLRERPDDDTARAVAATGNLTGIGLSATEIAALHTTVEAAARYLNDKGGD